MALTCFWAVNIYEADPDWVSDIVEARLPASLRFPPAGFASFRARLYMLEQIVVEELWSRRILPLASRVVVAGTFALVCGAALSGCHRAASGTR